MRTFLSFFWLAVFSFSSLANNNESGLNPELGASAPSTQLYMRLDASFGVPQSFVLDINEDQLGFLWFATSEALMRFDGYQIDVFNTDSGLPGNIVRDIFIDSDNTIWVATMQGMGVFDPLTETFKTIPVDGTDDRIQMWDITEGTDGSLIVASIDNLYVLDKTERVLKPYNSRVNFPNSIITLYDEPSRLWIGSLDEGAFIYDKRNKELFSLQAFNPWSLKIEAKALQSVTVINGEYLLGTDAGLLRIIEKDGYFETETYFEGRVVRSIEPSDGKILVAVENEIVEMSYSDNKQTLKVLSRHKLSADDEIYSILEDNNNTRWISTISGIRWQTNYQSNFPVIGKGFATSEQSTNGSVAIDVWGLAEDKAGNIWSANQNGELGLYDKTSGTYYYFQHEEDNDFWDIAIDDEDKIWIATTNGLKHVEYHDKQIKGIDTFLPNTPIYNLFQFNNTLWFSTTDNRLISVNMKDPSMWQEHTFDTSLEQARVVHADKQGRIWLSTHDGAFIYDTNSRQFLPSNTDFQSLRGTILAVHDYNGSYWVSTYNKGIIQFDKATLQQLKSQRVEQKRGPGRASVATGNTIWYAHANYISQFDLDSFSVVAEIKPSQLYHNDIFETSSLITADGHVVFGGELGYHIIDPDTMITNINKDLVTRPPLIREFKLNSAEMDLNTKGTLLTKPIHLTDKLVLTNNDKRFSFKFALVNSMDPQNVAYRYKLEGSDKNWRYEEQDLSRRALFHNEPWGNYNLLVQAREPGKDWSESQRLGIVISPPPWFSKPAIFLYLIAILLFVFYAIRQYQQRRQTQRTIRESEERLKLTLWSSGDELWDWDVYRGQVYRSNTWGTLDFPQDDIRTNSAYDGNIHPNDLNRVQANLKAHLEDKTEYYEISYRAKTFKNKWVWILDRGKVVARDHNNQPLRMTGTLKNIQHLKEAEEQMRLFERSIENISEGVFITDTVFRFISVNKAYSKLTGESRDQALASFMYFHQYSAAFTEEIKKTLRQKGNWSGELESRRVDGERYEMELNIDAVHDDDGKVSHYVGVFSDITERKNTEKELIKLAHSDPLTDLPNRSVFQASQQNLVRRGESHALLCLDMDNFKKINDSLGHQTGDVLIKQIAKRLQRITGKSATCYRLGGDEFSILMEDNPDVHVITHYAQNILDNLSRPFIINKQEFVLSASIGIAFYPNDGDNPQELLKNADTAMYFAKNSGGNAYKFFSSEMNQNAVRQLQIENLIRHGLKDDLFSVYYQPKVDIASGKLVSMEALVRFIHPQKGIVSPAQFIPLAEQTGQIVQIGEVVLEKALKDTKRWVDAGLFSGRVAVNISAKQFELPDLDDRISKILTKVGISALHLECEITEGTLMENPEQGLMMMQRLRERGIHLALDDFGTGYSSLAYLKQFPLNTLKIDKAFIDDIAHSSVDRHMAAAIINIAHNLGLNVVAEGVEHEEQLAILRRYDCELLQGYLYSKPLSSDRFEKLLNENADIHSFLTRSET
ncbi:EAL domain-containing protein [Alteromonas sediminis]|uniref:EAL domain-containing protein n=1 Tax=Alteromonas sediminis TaxID=2259342 RepID=A0A3N5YQK8_9ALTE|nr:EAL domain-containing protein [Alteromonas sediminis]RPJ68461.1 EAL domain-containing protein [Alteromonas sediminis]